MYSHMSKTSLSTGGFGDITGFLQETVTNVPSCVSLFASTVARSETRQTLIRRLASRIYL